MKKAINFHGTSPALHSIFVTSMWSSQVYKKGVLIHGMEARARYFREKRTESIPLCSTKISKTGIFSNFFPTLSIKYFLLLLWPSFLFPFRFFEAYFLTIASVSSAHSMLLEVLYNWWLPEKLLSSNQVSYLFGCLGWKRWLFSF